MTAEVTDVPSGAPTGQDVTSLPTIFQLLGEVKRAVGPVGKTERNAQQNFNYRGIDNVVNAAAPALDRLGVLTIPELLTEEHDTVEVGQKRSVMGYSRVTVCYHFYGPRGDEVRAVVPGEAMDSGDKAVSKAMSVAFRIALIQALNLPTGEPDADSQSYERSAHAERDESWRDQPPVTRQRGQQPQSRPAAQQQRPAGPPPPALDDADPWKAKIDDLSEVEEGRAAWQETVGLVERGQMTQDRASFLQRHIRARMAAIADGLVSQPARAAEPGSADPVTSGRYDPWSEPPPDRDPWAAEDPPAERPRIRPEDQGARRPALKATTGNDDDWIAQFMQDVADATTDERLRELRAGIGKAIVAKHITADKSAELNRIIRERMTALAAAPAGDAA